MTRKTYAILAAFALCASFALAGVATASGPAKTKVSIEAEAGGFFGFVHSKRHSCELNRRVVLFKVKSGADKKIGSDVAQPNGPDSQWSINTNKSGDFYAFTKKTSDCQAGTSGTVHSQ